jgi:hypothetical protein
LKVILSIIATLALAAGVMFVTHWVCAVLPEWVILTAVACGAMLFMAFLGTLIVGFDREMRSIGR